MFKNVLKNPSAGLNFADFFDLATDPDFETRMVYETGGDYPWQAKVGPFAQSDFRKRGKWTLICHNLEHVSDELYDIKKQFNFLPEWHADDVMATISDVGASVGAHIDDYSVFIFQGQGKRKWLLEENPIHEYFPDLDIRLLTKFKPKIEWILEPGDMLYIPPNIAHHGITTEKSISYSVGFKSIRYNNLLPYFVGNILENLETASFHDAKSVKTIDPFLLPDHVSKTIHKEIINILSAKEKFHESLLTFLASPRNPIENTNELSEREILSSLGKVKIYRDIWSKLVSRKISTTKYQIAINQRIYRVGAIEYRVVKNIFSLPPHLEIEFSKKDLKNENLNKLLISLVQDGVLYFNENPLN